ncbi:retropepsin-like aspartic protease [Natranaerobius thermophilus]|uniref:Peptidase A2 domain-containing protein n=1 Tax=Natranaerobius thermophilus (strain ATCC BAA-1301 / DSM 18059 / JW/NM-WN-LF) TaxID=457570 RepID=B2A102_NATTJ|nr:retropepsin-like aspartic protease [Natranaerobius thermophilus]ACB84625.1 conserved hypothetical protein [Natranaerobius thermophilus JW/NM-WN-LF]
MKIEYREGLLFTSVDLVYQGRRKKINNIVIDTGASETIISSDIVEDLDIFADPNDKIVSYYGVGGSIHNAFVKTIDEIKIGESKIKKAELDFGLIDINGEINGLLGLDILIDTEVIIDLKNMILKF